ncbi:MAG: CotH kinase family protein [Muribaculaceae bacterium]|nr:CotH kinase family protein [Muribaculaceae bacterium]
MKSRFPYIVLLCLMPLLGWSQNFDEMVAGMSELSLPLANVEVDIDSVNYLYFLPGQFTLVEYNNGAATSQTYNCQVRQRGGLALSLPKISFGIKLVDDEGEKLDANLLGLCTDNSWILDAMGIDKLRMRNRVCFDFWNEFSHTMWDTNYGNRNGTVGTMVEVFINSEYAGIYCLSDKINRKLLNLRKAKVKDDGSVTVKGLLYKGIGDYWSTLTSYQEESTDSVVWNDFELQYPEEYPSLDTWQPLMDIIDFNSLTDDEYFKDHYNDWYYDDNLVDYWILLVAFGISDMPYKNTFLSTPDINFDHRFMLTPWDLDACLGRGWDGSQIPNHSSVNRLNRHAPFKRLMADNINGFYHKLANRWLELTETVLSPDNVKNHITAIAQRFVESGAWQREYDRWKNTRVRINQNISSEVNYVTNWYRSNISFLNDYMEMWLEDYDPNALITSHTVTFIYNYLLGKDTTYYEWLDINKDGIISSSDVTEVYNILLNQ